MQIHLVNLNPTVGDLSGNAQKIIDEIVLIFSSTAIGEVQIVVFPELALNGYPIEDLASDENFQRATFAALEDFSSKLLAEGFGHLYIVLGYLRSRHNSLAVLHQGEVLGTYDKRTLPNYSVFDEQRNFVPGSENLMLTVDGENVGFIICEDLWSDEVVDSLRTEELAKLVVINASPFEEGKLVRRVERVQSVKKLLGCEVFYCNLLGGQDDLVFDGKSFSTLSLPALPTSFKTPQRDLGEVYDAIVLGIRDYVQKNGFKSVVLGASGGIDSALVAVLAADAIGGENVHLISMPSKFSSEGSKDDAEELATNLGAPYVVQPIAELAAAFEAQLEMSDLAKENIQARIRGMILMNASNTAGHLVLATGNKSELAVGYSTIYGDAVGGYAPIKDVWKTDVWALAKWRNAQVENPVSPYHGSPIPLSSIEKPPSAELRPGQTDQDSLPDYDVLDEQIKLFIEQRDPSKLDPEIERKVRAAEWKRRQYPIGPKLTRCSFGKERRMPIVNYW